MSSSKDTQYIRVGTTYYKYVDIPLISGDKIRRLVPWSRQTILHDHPSKILSKIKKFDGFCNIPNHLEYKEEHNNFLNLYKRVPYLPKEGMFETTVYFLKHIFGEQYEIGLDYLTILYRYPTQMLPILCLVSKERKTGKTKFIDFMKLIFSENMTYNTNEDFRSQFNSDWAGKLLICVDEVLLDRREDSERIKNLATASSFKSEAKGKDRVESEFFGKFILCSNHEDNFIQIDSGETRYWIRKIPRFEKEDINLLQRLKEEIPAFLFHLLNRKILSKRKTRMWFEESILRTEALKKVIYRNRTHLQVEVLMILNGIVEDFELEEIQVCLTDLLPFLKQSSIKASRFEIKQIFEGEWNLSSRENSYTYTRYELVGGAIVARSQQKGRYYTISKELLNEKMKER
ncbi:hypothetical protein SAMN05421640_3204 [Ekhidna lutea]|uniref:NrS-1 polymerase-like helicase domain-containing protein n=1 Tax=Ekhidna lutea TaxID=447679 RepID=A0A239LGY7_EKHLU|nr:primase-helicase family protein [Ekhidna lutea]SNT28814.1 hypothetical protein SAMN05421640_3204 [Ekhidna lutea]